jgi:hypothetical protein
MKEKGRLFADTRLGAKDSDIHSGDKVGKIHFQAVPSQHFLETQNLGDLYFLFHETLSDELHFVYTERLDQTQQLHCYCFAQLL